MKSLRLIACIALVAFAGCHSKPDPLPAAPPHKVGAVIGAEFWTIPTGYNPAVSGQLGAVGDIVQTGDSLHAYVRSGPNNTDWQIFPGANAPDGGYTVTTDTTLTGSGAAASPLHVVGGQTGSYQTQYSIRGAGFLGTSSLSTMYKGFLAGTEGWTQNLVGASGVAQSIAIDESTDNVNSVGGIMTMGTGTATTGSSQLIPAIGTARAPTLSAINHNVKFYRACRFMHSSANVDANSKSGCGSSNWLMGAIGPNSTTNWSLDAKTNAGADHYVTSTIAIDVNWHVLESWNDGTNACLSVDSETPVCVADATWWNLTLTANSSPLIVCGKVTGVVNYTCSNEWALWAVAAP